MRRRKRGGYGKRGGGGGVNREGGNSRGRRIDRKGSKERKNYVLAFFWCFFLTRLIIQVFLIICFSSFLSSLCVIFVC